MAAISRTRGRLVSVRHREDKVGVVLRMRYRDASRLQPTHDCLGIGALRPADRQLDRARRSCAIDGKARGIRPTVAHGSQHAGEQRPSSGSRLPSLRNSPTMPHIAKSSRINDDCRGRCTPSLILSTRTHLFFFPGNNGMRRPAACGLPRGANPPMVARLKPQRQ